ncbi:MAG: MerR family transcriptional regulator [Chitinophagaceae bacterium]|jgi:DNA-binding transcriptional MerR regulator
MDFYQINDLERLSGIKAHTIRIWEKRYGIITPYRTETNIRYYDDLQLKKLLNVATLASSGLKISKIAALSSEELKSTIKERKVDGEDAERYDFFINDLISSMLDFNEQAFNLLFADILVQFGVQKAFINIVYPFLSKTGVLWSIDETMPVQEHFATTIIKKKLFSLIEQLPAAKANKHKFLLFLPSDEWHELGLLFAEYIIRESGNATISLGQNVPFVDIDYVVKKVQPDFLLTFLISDVNKEEIGKIANLLSQKFKKTTFLLCGNPSKLISYADTNQIKVLQHPNDILKFI